ncbi:hypothetical protein [Sodalinema gerasimenkoae]|uniref:hypothetical protein n=1 Tax=Sodalinema gerasimenkoae TaxID=2862348 RepID=UPI001FEBCB66|nr:hypothetical protein [Sodalinema gerasimenkoae]
MKQALAELQTLYDLGWRGSLFIVDDNFIGNQRNVKRFLRVLIPWMQEHKLHRQSAQREALSAGLDSLDARA